ncbi:MAG: hypothetical protein K2L54_03125 [Clostridiales bacterium]|nr:hypothetical protein [Clostridiales bacterium]
MTAFLSNAFNDPSDPWYYVIGLLFLALIFGALAVYIFLSNKKKNKTNESSNKDEANNTNNDEQSTISEKEDKESADTTVKESETSQIEQTETKPD